MKRKEVVKSLWLITQVGFSMLAPIAVGAVIGYYIDLWLGTTVFFVFFLVLGIAAGYRNSWHLIKKYTKPTAEEFVQTGRKEVKDPAQEEFERWRSSRTANTGETLKDEIDEERESL